MRFFGGSDVSPSLPVTTAEGHKANMLYMFNRNGPCLFYREWSRPLHTLNPQQDHKLMFGLLFFNKSLTAKMDPASCREAAPIWDHDAHYGFRRSFTKLLFANRVKYLGGDEGNLGTPQLPGQGSSFTASGPIHTNSASWRARLIILVTHRKTGDLREATKYIYNLYVAKETLSTPGSPIRCELFTTNPDQYVRSIS